MTKFSELINNIASDLRRGGFIDDADELQRLATIAENLTLLAATRKEALRQIEMRCHVKWLGEFFLSHLSQNEWRGNLKKLAN